MRQNVLPDVMWWLHTLSASPRAQIQLIKKYLHNIIIITNS